MVNHKGFERSVKGGYSWTILFMSSIFLISFVHLCSLYPKFKHVLYIFNDVNVKGGSRTGAPGARPPFWKKLLGLFCKFWLYNTHILWIKSINHVYIMYFIHYSCYKHIGYVWRGIKTNPRPKNSTAPGPPPPFWNSWIRHWMSRLCINMSVLLPLIRTQRYKTKGNILLKNPVAICEVPCSNWSLKFSSLIEDLHLCFAKFKKFSDIVHFEKNI